MSDFRSESRAYTYEVETVAAELIKNGRGTPWEALSLAHKLVQNRRKAEQAGANKDFLISLADQ